MEATEGSAGGGLLRSPALGTAVVGLLSILFSLGLLELGLRIRKGQLTGSPDPYAKIEMVGRGYPGSHDARLGFSPTPGSSGNNNPWGATVTIRADGTRSNGPAPPPRGVPVLAVGDSFTFGDEVSDRESWPAALERILRRPVVNGGVFGYGFDQTVLRAELLLEQVHADVLIVGLIPDNVDRTEFSYRFGWKPYFELVDGALALRNSPVPDAAEERPDSGWLRTTLRQSFLADLVLRRLDPLGWLIRGNVRVHRDGGAVSALLLDRLADLADARGIRLLLLLQWHPGAHTSRLLPVIERAAVRAVEVLRMEPLLEAEIARDSEAVWRYFNRVTGPDGTETSGHMTARGNQVVADAIAARLARPRAGAVP